MFIVLCLFSCRGHLLELEEVLILHSYNFITYKNIVGGIFRQMFYVV